MILSPLELSLGKEKVRLVPVKGEDFYDAYDSKGKVLRYCITDEMVWEMRDAIRRRDLEYFTRLISPGPIPVWEDYRRSSFGDIRPLQEATKRMAQAPRPYIR